jgi:flagellar biosynthetic protein FlhB
MADSSDRTLPATPRRREAARRDGALPTAALPAWVATAFTAVLLLPSWGRATLPAAADMVREAIRGGRAPRPDAADFATFLPPAVFLPTIGLVLASAGAGLAVRFMLDGLAWHPGRAAPDFRRISLLAGIARIFSWSTLAAILGNGLGLVLLVAAAALASGPLRGLVAEADSMQEAGRSWPAVRQAMLSLAAAAAVIAACQWGLARLRFERRIRMTPQEFADEAKSMQADPKIRLLHQQRRSTAGTS